MKKVRIVEYIDVDNEVSYTIEQKHWLFRWQWVSASINSIDFVYCDDTFNTLEEAKENLHYFDGSKGKCKVVYDG